MGACVECIPHPPSSKAYLPEVPVADPVVSSPTTSNSQAATSNSSSTNSNSSSSNSNSSSSSSAATSGGSGSEYLPSEAPSDVGESQMVTRSVPDPARRRPRTGGVRVRKAPTKRKADWTDDDDDM